jgi:hypothetical protein
MGIFDRLRNSWILFKTSLAFLKRDKSLLAVPLLLPVVNIVALGIAAVIGVLMWASVGFRQGIAQFIFIVVFLLVMTFVNTFMAATQSWMVFEVAKGKDTALASGLKRAWHNLGDVILFTLTMVGIKLLAAALRGRRRNGFDVTSMIRGVLANTLETLTSIIGKLVLPAMIVTEKTFGEAVKDLQNSAKTWPEVLAFEFGIGPLTSLVFFASLIVLAGIAFVLYPVLGIGALIFTAILLLLVILTLSILGSFVNSTYYTLLYIALVEKKHIKGVQDLFRKF